MCCRGMLTARRGTDGKIEVNMGKDDAFVKQRPVQDIENTDGKMVAMMEKFIAQQSQMEA